MKTTKKLYRLAAALLIAFVLISCNMPGDNQTDDSAKAIGLPTTLPESVQEVIEEAEKIEEEVTHEQAPLANMNVIQMLNAASDERVSVYGDYVKDMLYTRAIDLAVINIQDDSNNAQRGFQFEGLVTVQNIGYATSPQVKLSCEVQGTDGLGGWQWVAPLAPGEARDIRVGFSGLEPGTYDYTCTIDADNTLIEFNKANNSMTTSINVTMSRTDLMIADVQNISLDPLIGYDHEFLVTIENAGPGRSYVVFLRCSYVEGLATTHEQIVSVGNMANAGDQVHVICGFSGVPAGSYELTVEVDWGNMMTEFDESNNSQTIGFTAK